MRIRFLSKGPSDQVSGGYLYNRYLMEHLRTAGVEVCYCAGAADLAGVNAADVVIVDGLAIGAATRHLLSIPARVVLLLHVVPNAVEIGPNGEPLLDALYRRSRVVVTGNSTLASLRTTLADAGIDAIKIEPGVPRDWRAKQQYSDRARRLLGVANYLPGKGIARLLDVLSSLRHLPWTLKVHGNPDFDPDHFAALKERIRERELDSRVQLLGPVAHYAVNREMLRSDLLVHFSRHESYSMVTAEAIACGLPVLSYKTGNTDSFGRSGLVRYLENDATEAAALESLIVDPQTYSGLRRVGSRETRTWQDVGREFVDWLGAD